MDYTRPRRRDKSSTADPSEEESKQHAAGGWSSINNQAGLPYTPLGEPILDFVFHVQRKRTTNGTGALTLHQMAEETSRHQQAQAKELAAQAKAKEAESKATGGVSTGSNSLDLTDPVRDLLALCTPRRADVIDASAAIRERVALADARIKTVRAGGAFAEIDRCLTQRRRLRQFQQERKEIVDSKTQETNDGTNSGVTTQRTTARSSSSAPASTIGGLSDESLGSALMQSAFLTLAKKLNDGSVSIHSQPAVLQRFAKEKLGGPFATNFEGNLFHNLPPHPLLDQQEESHPLDKSIADSPSLSPSRKDGVVPSLKLPSPQSTARSIGSFAQSARTTSRTLNSSRLTNRSSHGPRDDSSLPPHSHLQPLRHPHAPPAQLSFHTLRYTLHQSFGTQLAIDAEQAAATAAKKKRREKRDTIGSASSTQQLPQPPSTPHVPESTPRRGRPRTRREEVDATHPGADLATDPDRQYSRAVQASKYRREHNNSPTSHWLRLQEMVSQRTQQARALRNMSYFNPEGNLFQQGGMMRVDEQHGADSPGKQASSNSTNIDGSSSAQRTRSPLRTMKSIHSGQILRQVANTSWGSYLSDPATASKDDKESKEGGSSASSLLPSEAQITKQAELTLARCYADFDLAKKDLRQRLYESLAIMDTERSRLLLAKYQTFQPRFVSPEADILHMRLRPEKQRFDMVQERLKSLELLYQLIEFINIHNGGTNGASSTDGTPTGIVGHTYGASLPIFEVITLVEVIATLIDSSLPMRAGVGWNKLGEYCKKQDYSEDADVVLGKYDPSTGVHPSLYAMHMPGAASTGATTSGPRGNGNSLSTAARRAPASSLYSLHSMPPLASSSYHGSGASVQPIAATTPPPSYLLLLLCLPPQMFKFKEVRETLSKWASLCGLNDEISDAALRMIGIDPRLATYSGRGAIKQTGAGGTAAGDAAHMIFMSEGALGQALSSIGVGGDGTAGKNLLTAPMAVSPVDRPLSSVILSSVSLGDWESLKRGERVKQSARDLARRVKAVRDLTTSSNASTRQAIGLKGTKANAPTYSSTIQQQQLQAQLAHQQQMQHQAQAQAQEDRRQARSPTALAATTSLGVLAEEDASSTAVPADGAASTVGSPRHAYDHRTVKSKNTTGVSRTLAATEREDRIRIDD